jgi:hypothetical protein
VSRLVPGTSGWPRTTWVLRVLVLLLPVAALLVALPQWPDTTVVVLVVLGSARWAWLPDDLVGALVLVLVGGWWAVHGTTDARLLAVGVLLLAAHVAATLASYGPGTLDPGRVLVRLWVRRGLLALVPLVVAFGAVRLLDAGLAPPGLWTVALAATVVLLLAASRATGRVQR